MSRQWAPAIERFNARLVPGDNGCILYNGPRKPKGYGMIQENGVRWVVTRWSWTKWVGPIPPGMIVRHKCDNPPCVRLSHLELGTVSDNSKDMYARGREHPRMRQGRPRLADGQRAEIVASRNGSRAVANQYGVTQAYVNRLRRRALSTVK